MQTQEKIDYIKKVLEDLEKYCRENGFKCALGFGGGTTYSGGLMEWDDNDKKFIQKTESHVVRTYCNLSFRVTTKDSDYDGKNVKVLSEIVNGTLDSLGHPDSEDFETQED